jgi:hypothetical protein
MHDSTRAQNIAGVCKPTQQAYGACSTVRHIRLDVLAEESLQQARGILSSPDQISISLLVKRALMVYRTILMNSPGRVDTEREAVRRGARRANNGTTQEAVEASTQ